MALWEEEDYGIITDRACWAMFAILVLIVGLRVFCRAFYGQNKLGGGTGLDDYITIACLAVFLATCILVSIGSSYGLGRHFETIQPLENRTQALKYNVVISSVLIWTFSLPKFAFIATLKRILNYGTKTTILFWGLALSSQACILATSVWWYVQCRPVERGWNLAIDGECSDVSVLANLGYFTSAYSAFLDIFFALYPIPFIMRLNMPRGTRIAVATALGLNILACVVSIYKLAIFGQVFAILATDPTCKLQGPLLRVRSAGETNSFLDPVPYLDILGMAEGFVLIVCTSLPTLGPLFRVGKCKFSDAHDNNSQRSHNQLDSSNMSNDWDTFKGHNLDDPEQSTGTRPSVDVIPLVTSSRAKQHGLSGIHKTVEVSVSSESLGNRSQHARTSL